jgi:hypothetical protein
MVYPSARRYLPVTNPTNAGGANRSKSCRNKVIGLVALTALYTAFLYRSGGAQNYLESEAGGTSGPLAASTGTGDSATTYSNPASEGMISALAKMQTAGRTLSVATWNVAAINNNPFEYWITMDDNPEYEKLMAGVESFIAAPMEHDIPVNQVFTEEMYNRLDAKMTSVAGWPSVRTYWDSDFKNRKIVSEFLKDDLLGSKRLASMPDRITNTINVANAEQPVCRPTVINMYDGDLSTMNLWYEAWEGFMFTNPLQIAVEGGTESQIPYQMLQPIKQAKYPDITDEEEQVSLPLQTMCGAIFDAILVHMMNTVAPPTTWQPLKTRMVESLNRKKVPKTLEILDKVYGQSDVITLQEVSSAFIYMAANSAIGERFYVVAPGDIDSARDQNSVIFLNKNIFPAGAASEITSLVQASFPEGAKVPVAKGDILAVTTTDKDGLKYVVASFHGDTNGLATIPVVDAILVAMKNTPTLSDHVLLFGMDANTYEEGTPGKKQDVTEFGEFYRSKGLTSCWGDVPNPSNYTTFNARTYLQPQLNKACKSTQKRKYGDVNPKDFILFGKNTFEAVETKKDNTGKKEYIEDMAFPTLDFPSDHGVLSTILKPVVVVQL